MTALLDRVRKYADQWQLWSSSSRVIAAVSGGSDSVALLFVLRELASRGDLILAGVAHLDHQIRGGASAEDAEFCRRLAARLDLPAAISAEDVPALAAREGLSIEVAGRHVRQRFFLEAARSLGSDLVGVAHTRDDQAETVLLRLVRGAGPLGLSGIAPRRGAIVRPLLDVTRQELRQYLTGIGESWRDDVTNADRANPRNRMRHDVLPQLAAYFNPQVDAALARTADILREDQALLAELAADAAGRVFSSDKGRVVLNPAGLEALPAALARRVALRALETAHPGHSYGLEEAEALRQVAAGRSGSDVAGVRMERSGAFVVIEKRGEVGQAGAAFDLALAVPGSVADPMGRWVLEANGPVEPPSSLTAPPGTIEVAVDGECLSPTLHVRSRRAGDRLQPLGMTGRKKVQDVLVDRKVPRDERDLVPIVTDATGRIVWVAGHALDQAFAVTGRTRAVVMLRLRRKSARRPS